VLAERAVLRVEVKWEGAITMLIKTLAVVAAGTVLATSAFAQSAREVRAI
jgi:hypothetical protein